MAASPKIVLYLAFCSFFGFTFSTQAQDPQILNTQVVVIGSGASGLAAALTAAESGAKVIFFEKIIQSGERPIIRGAFSPLNRQGEVPSKIIIKRNHGETLPIFEQYWEGA